MGHAGARALDFYRVTLLNVLMCSDSISFSAIFVWCGFQTGNTVQVRVLIILMQSYFEPHSLELSSSLPSHSLASSLPGRPTSPSASPIARPSPPSSPSSKEPPSAVWAIKSEITQGCGSSLALSSRRSLQWPPRSQLGRETSPASRSLEATRRGQTRSLSLR